jgi:hypothetical protein
MSILSYVSTHIDAYCRMSMVKGVVGGLAGESEGGGVHDVQGKRADCSGFVVSSR